MPCSACAGDYEDPERTAPEPLEPDVSTFLKLMTVIEDAKGCESVAVTAALASGADAKARQISEVPRWAFARATNSHVRPAPLTLVTVVFGPVQ